eukprot:TRINITY_DN1948_c1_g1_i5.p1 TRINITY_DN1948_c1_g1~~TRINITY_DN1948_c1_g1_i5.p1  ORF type:complete len:225 (-),score=28.81 TRINITY_DN1948_c1_g1_i5:36-710(-)
MAVAITSGALLHLLLRSLGPSGSDGRRRRRRGDRDRDGASPAEAYARLSRRLSVSGREFTEADYDLLLELDERDERLERFLHGAADESIDTLPVYVVKDGAAAARAPCAWRTWRLGSASAFYRAWTSTTSAASTCGCGKRRFAPCASGASAEVQAAREEGWGGGGRRRRCGGCPRRHCTVFVLPVPGRCCLGTGCCPSLLLVEKEKWLRWPLRCRRPPSPPPHV